jgi:hypothetical protein
LHEVKRCEADSKARLTTAKSNLPQPSKRTKGPRYTPVAKRQDKPDGIAWLVRHHPELKDSQIARLIGTTKTTIQAVRERSHWNSPNIRPRDPVLLGLCSQIDLNAAVDKARKAAEKAGITLPKPEIEPEAAQPLSSERSDNPFSLEHFGLPKSSH